MTNKMYTDLASWWPLLSPVADYEEEAAFFASQFDDAEVPRDGTLLELGSGGGSNAFYLKQRFAAVTLTDLSPQMLSVSQTLNPDCEHIEGDMRTLRLDRTFDAVFLHDALDYMTTLEALRQAITTAFVHCGAGGVALLVPDYVRETFEPWTDHGGSDGDDGRAIRYLEWTRLADKTETGYVTDYVYVLTQGDSPPTIIHERHECGLFPRADWLRVLREVGFATIRTVEDEYGREIFIARKADASS